MTTLTGRKPKDTYKDLLQVSNSNAGIDSAPRPVEDGEGTASKLLLSTAGVEVDGTLDLDGEELVLDADGDTSITADTDDQIDVRIGGADVFKLVAAGVAGDKTWRLIESQTASASAALDFATGIDGTHDLYMFVLNDLVPATDNQRPLIRVSLDAGSTFKAGASDYRYHTGEVADTGASYGGNCSTGATSILLGCNTGSGAGESVSGMILLWGPSGGTNYKQLGGQIVGRDSTGAVKGGQVLGSYVGAVTAIDGVRFLFASGNIASGTIALYGLKK